MPGMFPIEHNVVFHAGSTLGIPHSFWHVAVPQTDATQTIALSHVIRDVRVAEPTGVGGHAKCWAIEGAIKERACGGLDRHYVPVVLVLFVIECVVQDDVELTVRPCLNVICGSKDPKGMVEAAHVQAIHDVLPSTYEGCPLDHDGKVVHEVRHLGRADRHLCCNGPAHFLVWCVLADDYRAFVLVKQTLGGHHCGEKAVVVKEAHNLSIGVGVSPKP
mmetsp:Transcript_51432/g.91822  ORF Transcript_51432/g.91822 Transcript_51432/m.91822 type:complete len:218 (+) Transcript_51432:986-1639(+)